MTTPKDAVLSIRLAAEDREALEQIAEENDEPIAQTARRAIRAFIATAGALLVILAVSACGSDAPAAQPVSEPSVAAAVEPSTTSSASPDVDLSQPGARREVVRRVDAGECLSISFGPTALEWSDWMSKRPEMSDGSKWQADFASWISGQPVGCSDTDRQALAAFG